MFLVTVIQKEWTMNSEPWEKNGRPAQTPVPGELLLFIYFYVTVTHSVTAVTQYQTYHRGLMGCYVRPPVS